MKASLAEGLVACAARSRQLAACALHSLGSPGMRPSPLNDSIECLYDISMNMLLVLASGLALWVAYGVLQKDVVIILANAISLVLIGGLVWLKLLKTSS
jgi:hypothetical protein